MHMEQSEVEQFISSRRARLNQEKSSLGADPRAIERSNSAGTGPDGSRVRTGSGRMRGNHISELRQQLQKERESEISSLGSSSGGRREDSGHRSRHQEDGAHYSSMKEQRLAEERRYGEHMYSDPQVDAHQREFRSRRQWDENEPQSRHRVRFDEGPSDPNPPTGRHPPRQRWEEEEKDLMQWARGQGRQTSRNRGRALTPPPYESPQKQAAQINTHPRSISAPVVAEGIAGIGAGNSLSNKRNKQREYAEELRAQIREKEEMKQREKQEDQRLSPRHSLEKKTTGRSSDVTGRPPRHSRFQDDRGQPSYADEEIERDYSRRPPRAPRRDKHEHYTPYSYPPPPGPTPHYTDYPRYYPDYPPPPWPPSTYNWPRPPYPQPPHISMDPYYPQPQPHHMGNPYLPPRRPEFRDPERYRPEKDGLDKSTRFQVEEDSPRFGRGGEGTGDQEWTSGIPGGSRGGKRLDKASYRAELEKQMKDRKEKDAKTRIERERYDVKKESEIYDPFGKGGCGAPVRDKHGKLVADLKKMRKINDERLLRTSSESPPDSPQRRTPNSSGGRQRRHDDSPKLTNSQDWKAKEEDQKKAALEEYRENLKRQVKEKEELKRREKEQMKVEEEKELERLEAERVKLKEDYQRELEKQRRKEAELKAKNEALQREMEEKKRQDALKKQEEELREAELVAEERKQALVERLQQQPSYTHLRSSSPPIPTLRHKMTHELFSELPPTPAGGTQPYRSLSPPVPALQNKLRQHQPPPPHADQPPSEECDAPPPRVPNSPPVPAVRNKMAVGGTSSAPNQPLLAANSHPESKTTQLSATVPYEQEGVSTDLIKELSDLRKRLQQERSRFTRQDGASAATDGIFSTAVLQKPRMVGRRARGGENGTTAPSSATLKDFVALKSSRRGFSENFPAAPQSKIELETEQAALLQHQEDNLARLRAMRGVAATTASPHVIPNRQSGNSLLTSDSIRLPVGSGREGARHEPSMGLTRDDHNPRRQWQLQPPAAPSGAYPRTGSPGTHSQFSVLTIDVDNMARRNEERARRLDTILNASSRPSGGRSDSQQEPQAILHNFLRRTNRDASTQIKSLSRQSERSLDCETGFHPIASELFM